MPEHYTPTHPDPVTPPKLQRYERTPVSGGTPFTGTPEWKVAARGTPDTAVRRTRKGRSTYEVTAGHVRYMTGPDPWREDGSLVTVDHRTIIDWADAWIAQHDQPTPCTCDDLTRTVLVLNRRTRQPIWSTDRQAYVTVERRMRRCHCQAWQPLLALDGGRRNSYAEVTPGSMSTGRRHARTAIRSTFRRTDPGETFIDAQGHVAHVVRVGDVARIVAPHDDPERLWVGHVLTTRQGKHTVRRAAERAERRRIARDTADEAHERTVIEEALAADPNAPEVTITSFPDVLVTIRRTAGTRWAVTIVRGDETIKMRARTPAAIARAVIA